MVDYSGTFILIALPTSSSLCNSLRSICIVEQLSISNPSSLLDLGCPLVYNTVLYQSSDMPQEMVQEAVEIVTMSVDKFSNVKNYEV